MIKKLEELIKKPVALGIVAGLVGIILGLLWGWYLQPVQWTDASPAMLHPGYQEEYLRMAIDSYGRNPDPALALRRYQAVGANAPTILATIVANPGSQSQEILNFVNLVQSQGTTTATPASGGGQTQGGISVLSYLLIAGGVIVVGAVAFFLIRLLRPLTKKGGELTPAQQAQQMDREATKEKTDYTTAGTEEPPIFQVLTTYLVGDELYNQFFEINSPEGTYIGQCGVEISDTIPVFEKPKRVRGIGVWLFSVKYNETTTAILMTPDGFNKESLRESLQKKGEPIMVEPNQIVEIETRALKMHVRVAEVKYGQGTSEGAEPEEMYFNRLTLELAAWPKVVPPE
jgi:hypothetical protein